MLRRSEPLQTMKSRFVPILLALLMHAEYASTCPIVCICKWKNGKQTVECLSKGLTEIPDRIDSPTQVLDLSGNNLQTLPNEIFATKKIIDLQKIHMQRCGIRSIENRAFSGLTNLIELDLSENLLENVPTTIFVDVPSLMRFSLKFNPLKNLQNDAFHHLEYLTTLELSNCEIQDINEEAFRGLPSLEWLYLDGNRLRTIQGKVVIPEHLKGLHLHDNQWQCDCHIKDFYAWLKRYKVPLTVEPSCVEPANLAGKVIKSVDLHELACLPDVSPTTFYLELNEGRNVSLVCHVHAIPEATVSWWFHGQILQNNSQIAPGVHLSYYVEEGGENKKSELFIFNTVLGDNGTFICSAENPAGITKANFTIKMLLQEKHEVTQISLMEMEYLLAIVIGVVAFIIILTCFIVYVIVKCCQAKNESKNFDKSKLDQSITSHIHKINTSTQADEHDIIYRPVNMHEFRPISVAVNSESSPVAGRYREIQNPDIINGARLYRESGDGDELRRFSGSDHGTLGIHHFAMVDNEGYPNDYGLPRLPPRVNDYYRTLPSNRRRQTRLVKDIEMLNLGLNESYRKPFDCSRDVRYTADGYPERCVKFDALSSSPPESFRSESCAKLDGFAPDVHFVKAIGKISTGAQTDHKDLDFEEADVSVVKNDVISDNVGVITESPDEGYEGEQLSAEKRESSECF